MYRTSPINIGSLHNNDVDSKGRRGAHACIIKKTFGVYSREDDALNIDSFKSSSNLLKWQLLMKRKLPGKGGCLFFYMM